MRPLIRKFERPDFVSVSTACIRFYEELNDFLPPSRRKAHYAIGFQGTPSVKSLIEGEGVPHTEVEMVLVNGNPVTFRTKIRDGDRISVYPVFESMDVTPVNVTRSKPLREPKFILDVHLGKLARYLRMMGFDTLYAKDYNDLDLVKISVTEKRCILTRDRKLLMRKEVERGYWIRSGSVTEQVSEVIRRLDLKHATRFFSRCTRCNGDLEVVDDQEVLAVFPGYRFFPGTGFCRCENCRHIYWNGSHCKRFAERILKVLE